MKKYYLIAIALIAFLILQSCGEDKPTDPNKDNYKFLYIGFDTTAHWKLVEYGLEKAKLDYPNVTFDAKYPTVSGSVTEQIAFIQQAITEGYGGIVIAPASESLLTEAFQEAKEKHLPIVIVENPTGFTNYTSMISTDNYKSGKTFAEYLLTFYSGEGKIAIMSDASNNRNNSSRISGFLWQMGNANYSSVFISPNIYHSNNYASAFSKITTVIQNNPTLKVIYATNGVGTLAAANALSALKKTDVYVLGYDNEPDFVNLLENGNIKALTLSYPVTMGYKAVEQLVNYKKGTTVTRVIDPGTFLLNKENINSEAAQNALYPKGK